MEVASIKLADRVAGCIGGLDQISNETECPENDGDGEGLRTNSPEASSSSEEGLSMAEKVINSHRFSDSDQAEREGCSTPR